MSHRSHPRTALPLLSALLLAACGGAPAPTATAASSTAQDAQAAAAPPAIAPAGTAASTAASTRALPQVEVYKSPSCGCCGSWVTHLQADGFQVVVHEVEDLEPVRRQLGVPYGKGSCHTARVDGYVVEGHVPAADIRRLLVERPQARGLVLPGMPAGSPGMEMPDGRVQPYTVELAAHDGSTTPWASHGPQPAP